MPPELRIVYLVARREFLTRVRSRFWLVGTVLLVLGMGGYIVLQAKVFSATGSQTKVGFTIATQPLAGDATRAGSSLGVRIDPRTVPDETSGERLVNSGELDALVTGDATSPRIVVKERVAPEVVAAIAYSSRQLTLNETLLEQQVDPTAVEARLAASAPRVDTLDPSAAQRSEREVVGVVVAVLLYVSLLVYGQVVAASVVEEKSNRIVEILLSTIRSRQLLIGKVLGIGVVGFLQLAITGLVGLLVAGRTQVITLPNLGASSVASGLLWFVLGFVLYSLLYAAAASLVSRQEDLSAVTMPLSFLVVGTYLAFFWVIANPTSPGAVLLSVLPPFAPILMPARIATGDATAVQFLLAVGLALVTIGALNVLAARIYSNSVLRIGSRVSLGQAWSGRS